MSFTVNPGPGDTLCSLARRYGFSNCATLREANAGATFLDRPLVAVDAVQIPQVGQTVWYLGVVPSYTLYPLLAAGRRWTFRVAFPEPPRQAVQLRFVRTSNLAAADAAIANVQISRYITDKGDPNGQHAWADHTHRTYNANAFGDPACFNVEVIDPNVTVADVTVRLEAQRPVYVGGARIGHLRFDAGALRTARSLDVTATRLANPHQTRHRSCYLRLVVDPIDKAWRPRQTLLVTDLVDDDGDDETEILDQDIRAIYEDSRCPRTAGERCIVAVATAALPRGDSFGVEARILRAARTGVVGTRADHLGDDGVVSRRDVERRLLVNTRRIYAQEALSCVIHRIDTVDLPSEMIAIADPTGANASGANPGNTGSGVVGFRVTIRRFDGTPDALHVVGPINVPAPHTPAQTAADIVVAVQGLNVVGLTATASTNPVIDGQPGASADVVFAMPNAVILIDQETVAAAQDAQQPFAVIRPTVVAFNVRAGVQDAYVGSAMQRCLYKAFPIDPQRVNLFVVQTLGGVNALAHTLNSQQHLQGAHQPLAAMENCIVLAREAMTNDLENKPATLPHEIGHALIDNAEHSQDDAGAAHIMLAGTSQHARQTMHAVTTNLNAVDRFITRRITDLQDTWIVVDDQPPYDFTFGTMGVKRQQFSMRGRINLNHRIVFTPR